jgi:hypothetical protein
MNCLLEQNKGTKGEVLFVNGDYNVVLFKKVEPGGPFPDALVSILRAEAQIVFLAPLEQKYILTFSDKVSYKRRN